MQLRVEFVSLEHFPACWQMVRKKTKKKQSRYFKRLGEEREMGAKVQALRALKGMLAARVQEVQLSIVESLSFSPALQ